MTDQELIQSLVKKELLTKPLADKVLKESEVQGRSPEDLLYEQHLADEVEVAEAKSERLKIPYKRVDPSAVSPDVLSLIPQETSDVRISELSGELIHDILVKRGGHEARTDRIGGRLRGR